MFWAFNFKNYYYSYFKFEVTHLNKCGLEYEFATHFDYIKWVIYPFINPYSID